MNGQSSRDFCCLSYTKVHFATISQFGIYTGLLQANLQQNIFQTSSKMPENTGTQQPLYNTFVGIHSINRVS